MLIPPLNSLSPSFYASSNVLSNTITEVIYYKIITFQDCLYFIFPILAITYATLSFPPRITAKGTEKSTESFVGDGAFNN